MLIPTSTYRLQLNAGLTFADAAAVVPYLASLGVGAVYTSPLLAAMPGSQHGYDVADPRQVSGVLGGEVGRHALVAAVRKHEWAGFCPRLRIADLADSRRWRRIYAGAASLW